MAVSIRNERYGIKTLGRVSRFLFLTVAIRMDEYNYSSFFKTLKGYSNVAAVETPCSAVLV